MSWNWEIFLVLSFQISTWGSVLVKQIEKLIMHYLERRWGYEAKKLDSSLLAMCEFIKSDLQLILSTFFFFLSFFLSVLRLSPLDCRLCVGSSVCPSDFHWVIQPPWQRKWCPAMNCTTLCSIVHQWSPWRWGWPGAVPFLRALPARWRGAQSGPATLRAARAAMHIITLSCFPVGGTEHLPSG